MSQKKLKTKSLRNILVTPFSINWSESNPEGVAALQQVLEELLPLAKLQKKSLELISKEAKQRNKPERPPMEKHNVFRTYLAPGFQSVIRGLEKTELCCVMMSGDISPPMIPRVICSYCHTHNVPLMVVPQLKHTTKSLLGFSTMVLGVKKVADSPDHQFFPIYEIVSQNQSVLKPLFDKNKIEETPPGKEEKSKFTKNEIPKESSTETKDVYLYRGKGNKRVFIPGMGVSSENNNCNVNDLPKDGMDADFISLSKSEGKSSKHSSISIPIHDNNSNGDNGSDCDSLDEDNIFFVDNNPDHMLLDTDQTNLEDMDTQTCIASDGQPLQSNTTEMKATKKSKTIITERYFTDNVKPDKAVKVRTKKKSSKQKLKGEISDKVERTQQTSSSAFKPLTIKTIISNPKKVKRKNK